MEDCSIQEEENVLSDDSGMAKSINRNVLKSMDTGVLGEEERPLVKWIAKLEHGIIEV